MGMAALITKDGMLTSSQLWAVGASALAGLLLLAFLVASLFAFKVRKGSKLLLRRLNEAFQGKSVSSEGMLQTMFAEGLVASLPTVATKLTPAQLVRFGTSLHISGELVTAVRKLPKTAGANDDSLAPSPLDPSVWTMVQTHGLPLFGAVSWAKDSLGSAATENEILVVFRGTSSWGELSVNDFATEYLETHGLSRHIKFLSSLGVPLPFPPQTALFSNPSREEKVNAGFRNTLLEVLPSLREVLKSKTVGMDNWTLTVQSV